MELAAPIPIAEVDERPRHRTWRLVERAIHYFFGGNAAVAIVVLALITIFLFREGFGFFGLMKEPYSALDPIATASVEELIRVLKNDYTIVIVTHNMQHTGRCSDFTAFFYLGKLVESGATSKLISQPSQRQTKDYITGRFG